MRLSHHTDYALRMLMYLSTTRELAPVDRIADAYGISRHHLMKVAHRLHELGYVAPRRGRGGGWSLARSPDAINVGQVVRELEGMSAFVDCFVGSGATCPVAGACGLQGALSLAIDDFLARLDGYTLRDLVPSPARFARALESVTVS